MEVLYVRGPPLNIQMDNAKELQSNLLSELLFDLGIHSNKICPYHPQSNGMVECLNKRIKQQLQIFKSEGITWDRDIPAIQLALNLQKLDELKTSPFQLLHGWLLCPTSFVSDEYNENDVFRKLKAKSEWSKAISVKMARAICNHYIADQSIKAKRSVKSDEHESKPLKISTCVLRLYKQPLGACAKLFVNWKGIFIIRKQIDVDTYLISLENDGRKKFIVHRRHLRPVGTFKSSHSGAIEGQDTSEKTQSESYATWESKEGQESESGSRQPDSITVKETHSDSDELKEYDGGKESMSELRRSERLKKKAVNFTKFFDLQK